MKRRGFLLGSLALLPVSFITKAATFLPFQKGKGFKINAGEARFGKHLTMKGITTNTLDIKISGQDTDGGIAVFEQIGHMPKGGPPLHMHHNQDEWFYILEGEYLFQLGEEKFEMRTGDTIFLPRTIPHTFAQLTEKARVMVSFFPAGKIENFFRVTDSWTNPPSPEEIKSVMEAHDMVVAGPPLKI